MAGRSPSRNQASAIVVVANDKGYEPMLEHAKAMGFAVRQLGHGQAKAAASVKATPEVKPAPVKPAAKKVAAKKALAKKTPTKKVVAKQPAVKQVPAKKAAANKAAPAAPAAKKAPAKKAAPAKKVAVAGAVGRAAGPVLPLASPPPAMPSLVSAAVLEKITNNLRKMGDKRPVKLASLRHALKSFLGAETADDSIEVALGKLIAADVVAVSVASGVSYPSFAQVHKKPPEGAAS